MGWQELGELAEHQYGVVDIDDALVHVSERQVRYALEVGRLRPVFAKTAVYRFVGAPECWEQRLFAACRATGGAASHRSGARLWGVSHVPALGLELTVPSLQVVRLDRVRAHRSNRLPDAHVTAYAGIPITTGARTLFDLSAVVSDDTLERAINDGLRRGVTTVDELKACFDDLAGRGRRRVAHLRPLIEERLVGFNPGGSDAELRVLRWIGQAGLPLPVQQLSVIANGRRYCLDFGYPNIKVGLEWDGWDDHGTRRAFDHDRGRRDELELAGWLILQFTSRMSRQTMVGRVRRALDQRQPQRLSCVTAG
jgi:hypothetical protein